MHQSITARFNRTKSNDLAVTFLPLALAFGLRGVLQKASLSPAAFSAVQVVLVVFLIVAFAWSYRFYFRAFRCTLVERGDGKQVFPEGSLTFERLIGDKARIYERVLANEMLCLLEPGQDNVSLRPERNFLLTAQRASGACRLFYRQGGHTYCAIFHPDPQQKAILLRWIEENQQAAPTTGGQQIES